MERPLKPVVLIIAVAIAGLLSLTLAAAPARPRAAIAQVAADQGPAHLLGAFGTAGSNCDVTPAIDAEEREMLRLINEFRRENGVPPVFLSAGLMRAASWKARDMAENDYFAHEDITVGGRSFGDRIRDCGYTFQTWLGEISAAGHAPAAESFAQWRSTPGHRGVILDANYVSIGLGRSSSAESTYRWYWTADFGGAIDLAADVDCSGSTDAIDAAHILQYAASLVNSLPCAGAADVDFDGQIDAVDATIILQATAGLFG